MPDACANDRCLNDVRRFIAGATRSRWQLLRDIETGRPPLRPHSTAPERQPPARAAAVDGDRCAIAWRDGERETTNSPSSERPIGAGRQSAHGVGLKLIVSYKFIKAAIELVIGVVLLAVSPDLAGKLQATAAAMRHHATEAWSLELAGQLIRAATERHLLVAGLAACLDGLLTFVEGWALYRRYAWSSWLVIGTTSCLLPLEGLALVRHVSGFRIALLVVNAVTVIYLVRGNSARDSA